MDIKYIEKKMEKIIPKGVSLLEFMTFGVIVMSTYIFFSNFSLLRLNRKMIREIIYIFSFLINHLTHVHSMVRIN